MGRPCLACTLARGWALIDELLLLVSMLALVTDGKQQLVTDESVTIALVQGSTKGTPVRHERGKRGHRRATTLIAAVGVWGRRNIPSRTAPVRNERS